MAQEVAIPAEPAKAMSLPAWLAGLELGTVTWPGQPTRTYLAGGLNLTSVQKIEAERHAETLREALNSAGREQIVARGVVLAKMLMAAGGTAMTEKVAQARAEAYTEALDDMPAWAIAQAVKRWHRGECGDHNYAFAPAPAVLRSIVDNILRPYRNALAKVETAINAITLDRAMDSAPLPRIESTGSAIAPRLRSV